MADKDTRDDLGAYGDPTPVADVPPSEGGPVTRDPAPEPRTSETSEAPASPPGLALRADVVRGDVQHEDALRGDPPPHAEPLAASPETQDLPGQPETAPNESAPPEIVLPETALPVAVLPVTAPQAFEPNPGPHFAPPAPEPGLRAPGTAPEAKPAATAESATTETATASFLAAADDHGTWRAAIADALFEPSPPPPEVQPSEPAAGIGSQPPVGPVDEPVTERPGPEGHAPPSAADNLQDVRADDAIARPESLPVHAPRASIELLPERTYSPRLDAPLPSDAPSRTDWQLETRPAPAIEPERPPLGPELAREHDSTESDAGFTAAAEDLFRPPEIERDPHLITIGRRLDPALRIPRPVAPVIAPRPVLEPRYEPDPDTDVRPTWKTGTWRDRLWIAGRYAAYAAGGYLMLVLVLIVLFRFVNPPGSMLMLTKLLTGNSVDRTWVPLDQISPHLVRAVIVSEDGRFCEHSGIDTLAIKDAIEKASGGIARGASTISMQVTKNLFLWNAKSYIRKVIEIPLTLVMEIVWPKRRILEMYLNIAEWGPGVFGAEAAAWHHFNKPAYRLNEREAALLAAVLPNPVRRDAGSPNTLTSSKARVVQARVKAYGAIAACVVGAQSRAAAAPQPAAAAPGNATATPRNQPARKTPQRKAPRRETIEDWGATVRMGPQ